MKMKLVWSVVESFFLDRILRTRTGLACAAALLIVFCNAVYWIFAVYSLSSGGLTVSPDGPWEPESYRSDASSPLGALAITSCVPVRPWYALGMRLLRVNVDFAPGDSNRRQGECWWDVDMLSEGQWLDLAGGKIEAAVVVPFALWSGNDHARVAGGQLILESESPDGHHGRLYSPWVDFADWTFRETLALSLGPGQALGWRDVDFYPFRIKRVGIKVALNDRAAHPYTGSVLLSNLKIYPPTVDESRIARTNALNERLPSSDEATLQKLPARQAAAPGVRVIPVGPGLTESGGFVRDIKIAPEPANPESRVWNMQVYFPEYSPAVTGRSARVGYSLAQPLDLRGKKVSTWVAVGPSLRGYVVRANTVQLEVFDSAGRFLRGPAANVSSNGLEFDSKLSATSSRWIKLEVPLTNGSPVALGALQLGFRADQVQRIGVRFLTGKFSNEFRISLYPLRGTMFLSEFRIEDDPLAAEVVAEPPHFDVVERPPVPIENFYVGVNYPWINYGYDAAAYSFGGRSRCGFSSLANRQKLDLEFSRFAEHGIRLVRVWILGDLRAGVVFFDADGKVVGIDNCVRPDVQALVEVARKYRIQLIPVLMDFLVADESSQMQFGARKWTEGEHADLITNPDRGKELIQKALRPVVEILSAANRESGFAVIYAVDVFNESDNAVGIFHSRTFHALKDFVREVRNMIRSVDSSLKVTLGVRNRDDLMRYWWDIDLDIVQYHFYDAFEEEEERPLHFPVSQLGFRRPVILGEVEPSDTERKLTTVYADGADGIVFWGGANDLDGYHVDLDAIKHWLDAKHSLRRH